MANRPEFPQVQPQSRPRPAVPPSINRDWLIFGLAAGCLVLAGVSICLTIAVFRRYTPRVVTVEQVVERPAAVPAAAPPVTNQTEREVTNDKLPPLKVTAKQILACFEAIEDREKLEFTLMDGSAHQYRCRTEVLNLSIDKNSQGQIVSVGLSSGVGSTGDDGLQKDMRRMGVYLSAINQLLGLLTPDLDLAEFHDWHNGIWPRPDSMSRVTRNGHQLEAHVVSSPGSSLMSFVVTADPTGREAQ